MFINIIFQYLLKTNTMKKIVNIILLLTVSVSLFSQPIQRYTKKWYVKKGIETSLITLSGVAYGYNQLNRHHYYLLKAKHPNLNEKFWGPEQWRNKYKNGDPSQGEAFWGSSRWFVMFTDAHHATSFIDLTFIYTSLIIGQSNIEKKEWYWYVIEAVGLFFIRSVAFETLNYIYEH